MSDLSISLTPNERDLMFRLLDRELGDTRSEVHHTHTPGFREDVQREEQLLRNLLAKLKAVPV